MIIKQMGVQPNLIKIKEDLSKVYGLNINNIFDSIYNSKKSKKEKLKKIHVKFSK